MYADYSCNTCKEIFEYKKNFGENFPKNPECPNCGSVNTDRFHGSMTFTFPAGNSGNAANNYTSKSNMRK